MRLTFSTVIFILLFMLSGQAQENVLELDSTLNKNWYGGRFAVGPSLLGGGLVGLNFSITPVHQFAFDVSFQWRLLVLNEKIPFTNQKSGFEFANALMVSVGPTYFIGRRVNRRSTKIISNGVFLKGGYSFGSWSEALLAVGWARESFKRGLFDRSFGLQLGAGFLPQMEEFPQPIIEYSLTNDGITPIIFISVKWNVYLVN